MQETRDMGLIPGLGRSPGGGHGNPLQYSCLENPKDRGAWWTIVYRVEKSQRWLKWHSTPRNTNLVSFNCTTSWCFLGSDLFWSKIAIKVMLDLLLSNCCISEPITHFSASHLLRAHCTIPWIIQPPYRWVSLYSRLFLLFLPLPCLSVKTWRTCVLFA